MFATGNDPEQPTYTYKVYSREFSGAMVYFKPPSYHAHSHGTISDATKTTHSVTPPSGFVYRELFWDGTVGTTDVTEIELRNGEGIILIKVASGGGSGLMTGFGDGDPVEQQIVPTESILIAALPTSGNTLAATSRLNNKPKELVLAPMFERAIPNFVIEESSKPEPSSFVGSGSAWPTFVAMPKPNDDIQATIDAFDDEDVENSGQWSTLPGAIWVG